MNGDDIRQIAQDVSNALEAAESAMRELRLLRRVITQACLTHGGEIKVDPGLANEAMTTRKVLEIGGGGIRLIDAPIK